MKAKALTIASLCAVAVVLALPASGVAATPTVSHVKGSEAGSVTICGLDLNFDFSFAGVEVIRASGISLDAGEFTSVWTNAASGKSIMLHGALTQMTSAPIDNGDGTISFVVAVNGTYIVKDPHGSPISLMAGRSTDRLTFDAATGDFVSVEFLSVAGPHSPSADSSCDSLLAALT